MSITYEYVLTREYMYDNGQIIAKKTKNAKKYYTPTKMKKLLSTTN